MSRVLSRPQVSLAPAPLLIVWNPLVSERLNAIGKTVGMPGMVEDSGACGGCMQSPAKDIRKIAVSARRWSDYTPFFFRWEEVENTGFSVWKDAVQQKLKKF